MSEPTAPPLPLPPVVVDAIKAKVGEVPARLTRLAITGLIGVGLTRYGFNPNDPTTMLLVNAAVVTGLHVGTKWLRNRYAAQAPFLAWLPW